MTDWKQIRFERAALYAEVWAKPMTEVAASHGISDTGLRKVCKAMNIPMPPAGFWAKRAAGHAVQVTPLPEDAERKVFVSNVPLREAGQYSDADDQDWLREQLAFEATPAATVQFDSAPQRFHPVLRDLASRLREAAANHAKEVKRRDAHYAARAKLRNPGPNFEAMKWMHLDEGFLIDPKKSHALRVTWLTYERALGIADALVRAAIQRECSVALDADASRLVLTLDSGELWVSIRERQVQGGKGPEPTDRLAVVCDGRFVSKSEIVDEPGRPVQDRIHEVFLRLYRSAVTAREWKRRWNVEAEEKARLEARQAAAAAALAEQERIAAEEAGRKEELLAEAARWHQAEQIRAYVAHLNASGTPDSEWRAWALRVADEMDPTPGRLAMVA